MVFHKVHLGELLTDTTKAPSGHTSQLEVRTRPSHTEQNPLESCTRNNSKFSFSPRWIGDWNQRPQETVTSASVLDLERWI
ncbi:hypothetical protein ACOMHN_060381 [Nucella lapillus]